MFSLDFCLNTWATKMHLAEMLVVVNPIIVSMSQYFLCYFTMVYPRLCMYIVSNAVS